MVLDIIPQVSRAERLPPGGIPEVAPRDRRRNAAAFVARRLQHPDVLRRHGVRPAGPERVDERQTGRRRPQLAKIDLPRCRGLVVEQQRRVADDERGIAMASI